MGDLTKMEEPFDDEMPEDPGLESDFPQQPGCACFRCGNCCRLWVFVNYEEADRIAARIGMPRKEFTIEYWDRSVSPEECLVIDQKDNRCFFLRNRDGSGEEYCSIYDIRPRVCRDYLPSLRRKECRDGLKRMWDLDATPTGRIKGDEKQVKIFFDYLTSLVLGKK